MDLPGGRAPTTFERPDLVAAAAVAIVALDADARIMSANHAATVALGAGEDELIGTSAHLALNAELPREKCRLEAAVRQGQAVHDDDDAFRARDGRLLPVWWATTPLRAPGTGELIGAVLVFGDRTVQRAREVADAAERDQGRAELAEARQTVADLEWVAGVNQALSSTLDEDEAVTRLARLVAGRLADVAITYLLVNGVPRIVGHAVRAGAAVDPSELVAQEAASAGAEPDLLTFRSLTAAPLVAVTPDLARDPSRLGAQARAAFASVGLEEAIALPLTARNHVVGLLVLIRVAGARPYSHIERLVARDIATRGGLAVDNARLYRTQYDIATRFQQALLPTLPTAARVRSTARYLPAREHFDVGGDWYDLFCYPGDRDAAVLAIGDVAGHDLAAGTTMSALRNLLRGVAVATRASPAQVLESVDGSLEPLGIDGTATILLMTARPTPEGSWQLSWSNAGHMPPILLLPDGPAQLLSEVHGTLLGTGIAQDRGQSELVVPGGSTVVLYTDGLVEVREESIDIGLQRLRRSALGLRAPLDQLDAVADELVGANHASSEDDTAMLVCHLPVV